MTDEPTPQAIPTEYRGVAMKSRLEASVAWLLDQLHMEWQYEPQSFLLPNGVNYWPDFYVPSHDLWVEARGYDTPKGRKQLLGFVDHLYGDAAWCTPESMETYPYRGQGTSFLCFGPYTIFGACHPVMRRGITGLQEVGEMAVMYCPRCDRYCWGDIPEYGGPGYPTFCRCDDGPEPQTFDDVLITVGLDPTLRGWVHLPSGPPVGPWDLPSEEWAAYLPGVRDTALTGL